jgi:Uma2 family endonuclease
MSNQLLTIDEFLSGRDEFPDGGRWTELWLGRMVRLTPPDELHGVTVMNLGRRFGEHLVQSRVGTAVFSRGLIVTRSPDTLRFPAIAFFAGDTPDDAWEETPTDQKPDLVVELASSNDRRRGVGDRVRQWQTAGVHDVWVVDTQARRVGVYALGEAPQVLEGEARIHGRRALVGLSLRVDELFAVPGWWTGP